MSSDADVIEDGEQITELPDLDALRGLSRAYSRKLPEWHRRIEDPEPSDVRNGDRLQTETNELRPTLEPRPG